MMDNFDQTPDKQAELLREEEDAALVRAAVIFACCAIFLEEFREMESN
jgi:hypothetical protein